MTSTVAKWTMTKSFSLALSLAASALASTAWCADPDTEAFDAFKQAIEADIPSNGRIVFLLTRPKSPATADRMQRYAETECTKGKKAACSIAYCGAGVDEEPFFSKKCADVMGRSYEETWMEGTRDQQRKPVIIAVRCLATKYDARIECNAGDRTCRHNDVRVKGSSVLGVSGYFPTLAEAARDVCSAKNAPPR
jgi:hypothetical protein